MARFTEFDYSLQFRRSPRGMGKAFAAAREPALSAVGKRWYERMLRRHFESGAVQRYGYQKRKKRYSQRKARAVHHQRPLVYRGLLKEAVTGAATIRASSRRVTVRMHGPRWLGSFLSIRAKRPDFPDIKAELTAINEQEGVELALLAKSILAEAINRAKDS